ncbi:hypothetical protein [Nesterenkonia suensis]
MPQPVPRRRPVALALAVAACSALLLVGCGEDPAIADRERGGGPIGDPGGEQQLRAPEPEGNQLPHEQMAEALEEHLPGATITDTDDVLPGLRDLETELQRLRVDPQECKQYVVQSASPLPDGALMVHAAGHGGSDAELPEDPGEDPGEDSDAAGPRSGEREATTYSFVDWEAADAFLVGEQDGAERCESYTASRRAGGEGDDLPATEVELETVPVRTAADASLGMAQEMTADGDTSHVVAVMLRQGSQVLLIAEAAEEEPADEEREELVEELQEQAAAVLSALTGEDLTLEDEDEDEEDAEDAEDEDDAEDDPDEEDS